MLHISRVRFQVAVLEQFALGFEELVVVISFKDQVSKYVNNIYSIL